MTDLAVTDGDQGPDISGTNPFELIAYLLFKVRHSLEGAEQAGRAPRWVRISRARVAQGSSDVIGKGVKVGVNGFAEALSYMLELTLDIRELLVQTDAGKALVEVSADLVKAATSDEFVNGVRALLRQEPGDNPLGAVGPVIDDIRGYLDFIPDPDDVDGIGHELYRMLCIVQLEPPRNPDGTVDETKLESGTTSHVDVGATGKVRLMQWAFGGSITARGLGPLANPESDQHPVARLGSRRLWRAASTALPQSTVVQRGDESARETLVEFFFDTREPVEANRTLDLVELHTVLEKLGYTEPAVSEAEKKEFTVKLAGRLRRFQIVNGLPITGQLDNPTLNRLFNLDFQAKNIVRAKPFDPARIQPEVVDDPKAISNPLLLVNPGADDYAAEGIELQRDRPGYAYYVAGRQPSGPGPVTLPSGGGWISDTDDGAVPGFVALQSRLVTGTKGEPLFDGGRLSEGEAAEGLLFFAARHVEPWEAGRSGTPEAGALFEGTQPPQGTISRLYQWVALDPVKALLTAGEAPNYEILVWASVLRRSLYTDRNRVTKLPDQGRLLVELYGAEQFADGPGSRRAPAARLAFEVTPWFPEQGMVAGEPSIETVNRRRNWHPQTTKPLPVPAEAAAVLVALEGRHQSAWDTDAYFDELKLYYRIRPKSAATG